MDRLYELVLWPVRIAALLVALPLVWGWMLLGAPGGGPMAGEAASEIIWRHVGVLVQLGALAIAAAILWWYWPA